MRFNPKWLPLVLILLFAACSARTLGVRYADKLAMREIDRMFDLSDEQDDEYGPKFKAEIERLKQELLPAIITRLEDYGKAWERGPTEADARAVVDEYDAVRLDLVDRLGPLAAKFLAGLSPAQVTHLESQLAEGNESMNELLEESPEDFVKKRRKGTLKNFEHWLGSVADDQEAKLLALAPPDRAEFERNRTERLASQKALLDLLKARTSQAEILARLTEWTKDPYKMRGATPEQGQLRRQKMIRILTETHGVATAEQRQHAKAEIQDLIADLKAATR